ncbi:MAG: hypothetical protein U1B80_02965, partial [Anaerolineaceae bacterium]|nr:hypothetical protein [Anaerolineaceae bacterium]
VDVVIPESIHGLEPMHAVYLRHTCLPVVKAALEKGERRMVSWFSEVRVRVIPLEEVALFDPESRIFMNVNTPAEFLAAEALAHNTEGANPNSGSELKASDFIP